jgi:2-aminoadipate transaminase
MNNGYDPLASVQAAGPPGTISFVYGLPDPESFPAEDLKYAMDSVLSERPRLALQYGPEQGYGPLIDFLRGKMARDEGLHLERPDIMLTGGSAQALDHLCTLFTRPGDIVLVEAPSYYQALQLLGDHDLRLVQIPTDDAGMQVEALADRVEALAPSGAAWGKNASRVRFLYTIPNFQNPGGITLAAGRRQAVLDLAERHDLLVVEDDVYRDLAYEGEVPPSFFALDVARSSNQPPSAGSQRVLRIGSFSKILAPGLRLGWLLGPRDRITRLIDSGLRVVGGGANPLVTNMLADYCRQGLLEPHIDRLRQIYRERRDIMLAALKASMPPGVRWTQPGGGFFVWVTLPEPLRAVEVAEEAREAGIMVLAGDPFFAETPTGQHLRLAFSYVTPEMIRAGIETLGQVLRSARERAHLGTVSE